MARVLSYGEIIEAPYVKPHPVNLGQYVSEPRPAKVEGFSHPGLAKRAGGWRGCVFVRFADGSGAWVAYPSTD